MLNATERVINTFEGKPLDRLPVFDIIHNTDFIEEVSGKKITPGNAEDVACEAVRKTLDLVRHFCIPEDLEVVEVTDEDGFVFREEWWTKEIIHRPIRSMRDATELMKKDIDRIYRSIEKQKFCHQAKEHLNLFGEKYDYPEEVNDHFERVAEKLGDTMMIAPEIVPGMYTAQNRFGFDWLIFIQHDHPELFLRYYDALVDHELFRIDCFAPTKLSRVALVSESIAFNTGLIWPPEFIRGEVFPRVKKCVDRWKKYGYYVIWHSDGNKWEVIPDILEMGVDSINPCEPLATMEVKKFRKLYPDTVIGSMVDCQDMLAFGTPQEVARATEQAIADAGGAKTLIGSTSEIHPQIKVANALAMYEAARRV
ncbi:hypothetical protein ES707_04671 [subsurface metagenome]